MKSYILKTLWQLIYFIVIPVLVISLIIFCFYNPGLTPMVLNDIGFLAIGGTTAIVATVMLVHAMGYVNFFFTLRRQERAIHIVNGTQLVKVIITSNRYVQDDDYNLKDDPAAAKVENSNRNFILRWAAVDYIGIPFLNTVLSTKQTWFRWDKDDDHCLKLIPHVAEETRYLFLSTVDYGFEITGVEDKTGNILSIKGKFLVHPINTYKPIFGVNGYIDFMTDLVTNTIREMAKKYEYVSAFGEIINSKSPVPKPAGATKATKAPPSIHSPNFCIAVVKAIQGVFNSLVGFELERITISDIALETIDSKRILEENSNLAIARVKAQAVVAEAKGNKEARELEGQGEGSYRTSVAKGDKDRIAAIGEGIAAHPLVDPEIIARIKNAPYHENLRIAAGKSLGMILKSEDIDGEPKASKKPKP